MNLNELITAHERHNGRSADSGLMLRKPGDSWPPVRLRADMEVQVVGGDFIEPAEHVFNVIVTDPRDPLRRQFEATLPIELLEIVPHTDDPQAARDAALQRFEMCWVCRGTGVASIGSRFCRTCNGEGRLFK